MKKYLVVTLALVVLIPNLVFAAWWNPFSWKIFHKAPAEITQPIKTPIVSTSTPVVTSTRQSTSTLINEAVINKKPAINPLPITKTKPIDSQSITPTPIPTPPVVLNPPVFSWEQSEIKNLAEADLKGWTAVSITSPVSGEVRYYGKENGQWVRKASKVELQTGVPQTLIDEAIAGMETINNNLDKLNSNFRKAFQDSDDELERLNGLLGGSDHNDIMSKISVQESYQRLLGDEYVSKKIKMLDGLIAGARMIQISALFPDNNAAGSTQLLNTLLEQRQELVNIQNQRLSSNQVMQINLQLSQLHLDISNLKSSLNSTPAPLSPKIEVVQPPTPSKWTIRWEGNGVGSIITPNGEQRFHCESGSCQSY